MSEEMITAIQGILAPIHPILGALSGWPLIVFLLVAGLTAAYILLYLTQGARVWFQLWNAVRRVRAAGRNNAPVPPSAIAAILKKEPFRHLWEEYSDTLHELRKASNENGVLTEVRATVPAEAFFTRDVLVDSRLFDEATRHLPGVLTGLGIIGTFSGLLEGLSKFDASSPSTAVAGLKPLLDGVAHAFVASAIAIGCAMFVVFTSRFVLAVLYRQVEKLNHGIDALYATGAGEEYLARLVQSSENSEAHAAQLKQALVEDLTALMTNLTERQIRAQVEVGKTLGTQLGNAITSTLSGPLEQMTRAMQASSEGNSQAVSGMLESLLTGFMAKLEDTFGSQMRGIHDQMDKSAQLMTSVQQALQGLVEDMNRSSEQATSRLSQTLEEAMKQAASNQEVLTNQMHEFVRDFRKLVEDEQAKAQKALDESVSRVLQQLSQSLTQMEEAQRNAAAHEKARTESLASHTEELVGGLSGTVEELLKRVAEQVQETQRNVDAISGVTTRAIDGMNSGAVTMESAAKRFESAGSQVSGVFDRSAKLADQLGSVSAALQTAATALQRGFDQYESARRTVDANIGVLTSLIENAKREAGLSKQMLADIERVVAQLRTAEGQSLEYLQGVNNALVAGFEAFGTQLREQIKNAIAESDVHVSKGMQYLNGAVQELAIALSRLKTV